MTIAEQSMQLLEASRWNKERVKLVCTGINEETHNVHTYYFQSEPPVVFYFKPGQFVTIEIPMGSETVYRSYTVSSSPSRPHRLALTVKKIPGGKASNWLADHLHVGGDLWATGPSGNFNLVDIPADKYLFLSAGSGITPMMAMTRWLVDIGSDVDICFIHSARSEQDIIFKDELLFLSEQNTNFKSHFILEETSNLSPFDGRINSELLQQLAADLHDRTLFVCGPAPYMDSIRKMVDAADFDMSRFHMESYNSPETGKAQPMSDQNASPTTRSVQLSYAGDVIEVSPDELILDALEKSGNPQPSACRAGVCGACKVQALQGEVDSSSQLTLTEEEVAEGYFLSCCSKAKTDLQLAV